MHPTLHVVGAVLQQHINGNWHPISFFSRKLTPAETRYSTFDRELLAVYLAIKHFHHFLEGRTFHVLTDHKPLTYALHSHSNRHSPRQARQLDYISQFTFTIRHVHGVDNVVADALSRIESNALLNGQPPKVDFTAIAEAQTTDPQIHSLQSSPTSTLVVEAVPLTNSTLPLYCDTSMGTQRPIVPLAWHRIVFDSLHSLSHPGIRAMYSETYHLPFCLAGYQCRCPSLDSHMYPMSTCEDQQTHYCSTFLISHPQHPLRCCPHRPCWTTSILSGLFLPPYLCGSIHPLA